MHRMLLPAALATLVAAAPAVAAERSFDLSGFTEIEAGSGLEVEIVKGEGFTVVAEGSPSALRRLDIETRGNLLVIEQRARGVERFSPLMQVLGDTATVRVTLPDLEAVRASAGSDVTVEGSASGTFAAAASSGADLVLRGIDAATVTLAASSGAGLEAAGRCGTLDAEASSGAGLDARALTCASATARASSGADVDLTATTVRAEASSGADVDVWGADAVEADESSGGRVARHD